MIYCPPLIMDCDADFLFAPRHTVLSIVWLWLQVQQDPDD